MRARLHTWLACTLSLAACEPETRDAARARAAPDSSQIQISSAADTSLSTRAGNSLPAEWKITPGHFGPLTSQTSEDDLRRQFGDSVIASTRIELGEGETSPGTVLFPVDSTRRAEIIWQDTVSRRHPARVVLRGNRSLWHADRRISLGTSLQELERLNTRPFTLAGFGWDYAGVVTDWNGGSLDSALATIKLYLDPAPAQQQSTAYSQVLGDRDYASSLPAMQQLNPRVTQIFVDFEGP